MSFPKFKPIPIIYIYGYNYNKLIKKYINWFENRKEIYVDNHLQLRVKNFREIHFKVNSFVFKDVLGTFFKKRFAISFFLTLLWLK